MSDKMSDLVRVATDTTFTQEEKVDLATQVQRRDYRPTPKIKENEGGVA